MKEKIVVDERYSPLSIFVGMDPRISTEAKIVYAHLRGRAHNDERPNICYPSQELISAYLCVSVSTVKRAIQELVDYGYIIRTQKKKQQGKHNEYRVVSPWDLLGEVACKKRTWGELDDIVTRKDQIYEKHKTTIDSIVRSRADQRINLTDSSVRP